MIPSNAAWLQSVDDDCAGRVETRQEGMLVKETQVVFDGRGLHDLSIPCFEAIGSSDGPHLMLVSGVHGGEYCSVAAVRSFMNNLDTRELSGRVTAIPVACPSSFWDRTPFVTPEDGKNLNRVFPGIARGTFAERLAFDLFEHLILGSDYLLHLHGGAAMELIEPFVGYDTSPEADVAPGTEETSRAMALAYGFRYVLQTERVGSRGTPTMLRTAAAEAGIPAVLAEAGDKGLLDPNAVRQHVGGIRRVMERLAMFPGPLDTTPTERQLVKSLVIEQSRRDGWWEPTVSIGEQVVEGAKIGVLQDLFGNEIEPITASADGVCLVLTTSPAISGGGTLAVIGAGIQPFNSM